MAPSGVKMQPQNARARHWPAWFLTHILHAEAATHFKADPWDIEHAIVETFEEVVEELPLDYLRLRAVEHFQLAPPMRVKPFVLGSDLQEALQAAASVQALVRPACADQGWCSDPSQAGSFAVPLVVIKWVALYGVEKILPEREVGVVVTSDAI